jgi:hypothetical protein
MTHPHNPNDEPGFDPLQFEAAALARVAALRQEVSRLAIIQVREPDWEISRGAQYDMQAFGVICVEYTFQQKNPNEMSSRVKISKPPVESVGSDGQRRRVTVSRYAEYRTDDEPDKDAMLELEAELPPANPNLQRMFDEWYKIVDQERLTDKMMEGYRPSELILGGTRAAVECKLPNSSNYRTERYSDSMTTEVKTAHMAARRHAGEPAVDVPYTAAEHQALMALLQTIDPALLKPEPLPEDFDETWIPPMPPLNIWRPRN